MSVDKTGVDAYDLRAMPQGIFISFEGSEGCGKSTQIARLRERLLGVGVAEVVVVREPGGTAVGERVRDLLQHAPEGMGMTPECELLLFAASRAQLVRETVAPALAAGRHVIADRFLDSTTVYQGAARGLDRAAINRINGFAVGACRPDVTVLLDMDSARARERARERGGATDRMESEPDSFYEKVRAGYLALAAAEPGRFVVLDAARAEEALAEEIWNMLEERYHGVFR